MNKWNEEAILDDEGEAEHIEFDELQVLKPLADEQPAEEPSEDVAVAEEPPLATVADNERVAPEGYVFAIYTGHADSASLGDIVMKPGAPTLVSKEQSLTLLTHPFESFVISDRVFIEEDKE